LLDPVADAAPAMEPFDSTLLREFWYYYLVYYFVYWLAALLLARREQGEDAFESYYAATGAIVHDRGEPISAQVARQAADAASMPGLVDRAAADPTVVEEVLQEYRDARELDVFGVPTLQLDDALPIYGPILPEAPEGDDALDWWRHVSWLIERDDLYELKRWPRPRRPA